MRTYSHSILTYAAIRLAKRGSPRKALAAALGAAIPDAPMALGAAWLWAKRKSFSRSDFDNEVCGRSLFRTPDAALHSALAAASALALEHVLRGNSSAPLLGWAGHVLADFLTHGKDARPVFWPVSNWRFQSPVSYRKSERYGRIFTLIEHAAVLTTTLLLFAEAWRTRQKADG